MSADGSVVVSGGEDASLRLWAEGWPKPLVQLCNAAVRALAINKAGRRISALLDNGEVLGLELKDAALT